MDSRTDKKPDVIAYAGIGIYSTINAAWIVWAFTVAKFGIFHTAILIGLAVPAAGLLSLIIFQRSSREHRFSALANALSVATIVGWFICVWYIVAAASAAV